MTPKSIANTINHINNVKDEYEKFTKAFVWIVVEMLLGILILNPFHSTAVPILSGLVVVGLLASIGIRITNDNVYRKVHSVSSSKFMEEYLSYNLSSSTLEEMSEEDKELAMSFKDNAKKYITLASINLIVNAVSTMLCIALYAIVIIQMLK